MEHQLGGTREQQTRAAAALTSLELSNSLGVRLFFPDLIYVCGQGLGWETDKLSLALSLLAFAGDVELRGQGSALFLRLGKQSGQTGSCGGCRAGGQGFRWGQHGVAADSRGPQGLRQVTPSCGG